MLQPRLSILFSLPFLQRNKRPDAQTWQIIDYFILFDELSPYVGSVPGRDLISD